MSARTPSMLARWTAVALGALSLGLSGCEPASKPGGATPSTASVVTPSAPSPAPAPTASHAPPIGSFAGLVPYKPPKADAAVTPPESLLRPWRAFVNQTKPRQKKNPLWQPLPPDKAVILRFDEPGAYECLVTPLEIVPQPDDWNKVVKLWLLIRRLRCSSDGWRNWSEKPHAVMVKPDGTETRPEEQTELVLKQTGAGRVSETVVWLRSDERRSRPPPPESAEVE